MASSSVACPDPSAHRNSRALEQASAAAALASSPSRRKMPAEDILDKDNRLSSRSAAMSLKHANPEDLPSFPSSGGVASHHTTGAANLAHDNQKPFEHWKPDPSSAASKAALLAKDYKMAPLWKPDMSAAGSKAALLAAKDGGKVDLWYPEPSANGSSAAAQAFRNKSLSTKTPQSPINDKALLAATKSVSRARSGSTPAPALPKYPDSGNSAHNALNAATKANRSSRTIEEDIMAYPALEESRIKHLSDKISRDMFTSTPPVDIEVEEKRHQDALRASAVSMAKGMYELAQRKSVAESSSAGATAATAAASRNAAAPPADIKQQAMQYIHLQEAAHRLAEERLAKLDPDGAARYREHYGYPLQSARRKLTMKNRVRRRANSESNLSDSEDETTTRRIRHQMSQFNRDLEAVDEKKRQTDRAALLAAAEKKVQAQMQSMDEKVYAETGKVSQAKMAQWEAAAREKAAQNSEIRQKNFGKQDIGGGRYMEQSEIEAIAAARLKPTLDEITETAEKRRARDEEIRLEQEARKKQLAEDKKRVDEEKAIQKRTRNDEKTAAKQKEAEAKAKAKAARDQERAVARVERDAEKVRKAAQKQAIKDSKRQTNEAKKTAVAGTAVSTGAAAAVAADEPRASVESAHSVSSIDSSDDDHIEPVSPVISKTGTGEPVLRPEVERHVTEIDSSESEDEMHSPALSSEPERGRSRHTHNDSLYAVTTGDSAKTAPEEQDIDTAAETSVSDELITEKRIGTDGEIGKTTPILPASDAVTAKEEDTLHDESNEGKHIGTDGEIGKTTPAPLVIDSSSKKDAAPTAAGDEPKSPKSPRRLSRFFTKLRHRSQATPDQDKDTDQRNVLHKNDKEKEVKPTTIAGAGTATKPATTDATSAKEATPIVAKDSTDTKEVATAAALAGLVPPPPAAPVDATPTTTAHPAAEAERDASPSSFLRHEGTTPNERRAAADGSDSDSLSSLSSDGPDTPAFRGLVPTSNKKVDTDGANSSAVATSAADESKGSEEGKKPSLVERLLGKGKDADKEKEKDGKAKGAEGVTKPQDKNSDADVAPALKSPRETKFQEVL